MIFKRLTWVLLILVSFRSFICWFCITLCVVVQGKKMAKIRLFIKPYKQGAKVDSVPVKQLIKLSGFPKKRWEFKDGWLILEAM